MLEFARFQGGKTRTYPEVKGFFEEKLPQWLDTLTPRIINAPSRYWAQKVLSVGVIEGVLSNQILSDIGQKPDLTFATLESQMGQLLEFDVPTFYVSKEVLLAALRTDVQVDLLVDSILFPFPALVFMLPRNSIRHPTEGECPFIIVSRSEKGQTGSLPLKGITISRQTTEDAICVSTYLPEARRCYHKGIGRVEGESIKIAFERASRIPFSSPDRDLADSGNVLNIADVEFADRLWLLGITLLLIMVSGENLVEHGTRLKVVKQKNRFDRPKESWSPNFLGRLYESESVAGETERHLVAHWRKGHLKSQPYGPKHSLRKIIWIRPYRVGG